MNPVLQMFRKLPAALRYFIIWACAGLLLTVFRHQLPGALFPAALIGVSAFLGTTYLIHEFFRLRDRRQGARLDQELTRQSTAPSRLELAEKEREYRRKWREGVDKLTRSKISLYELPWYIILGEPGGGKTMTLLNSGMDFPLGKDELAGFGGTRNYNWWFTNTAVILDTAGRLVFEQEGTTDRHEWEAFLRLLKKRRRCPINGVIVALPADKLMSDTPEQRHLSATIIRDRLRQIQTNLDVRFPVFLLITKADLVAGFTEFFNHLDSVQRNQLFGWSRPGDFDAPFDPREFDEDFEQLYGQLHELRLPFLSRPAGAVEIGWIYTFPEALRCLKDRVQDYIDVLFSRNIFAEPLFFRGFYFTSALQEGRPILDILGARLSKEDLESLEGIFPQSRAFFIHDFYTEKVSKERGMVFRSQKHIKRMRLLKNSTLYVGVPLAAAFAVLMILAWRSYQAVAGGPREAVAGAAALVQSYQAARERDGVWVVSETAEKNDVSRAIELANQLDGAAAAMNRPSGLSSIMFTSVARDAERHIRSLRRELVGYCVLQPEVVRVETALGSATPELAPANEPDFASSLATYLQWHFRPADRRGLKDVEELRRVLPARAYPYPEQRALLEDICVDGRLASALGASRARQRQVIADALQKARAYWLETTDIARHDEFAWWTRLFVLCADVKERYEQLYRAQRDFENARQPKSFDETARNWLSTFPQADAPGPSSPPNTLLLKLVREHLSQAPVADGRLLLPEDIVAGLETRNAAFWKACLDAVPDNLSGEDGEFAVNVANQINESRRAYRDPIRANLIEFAAGMSKLNGVLEPRPPDKPRQFEFVKSAEQAERILDDLARDLVDVLAPLEPYAESWISLMQDLLEREQEDIVAEVDRAWQPAELKKLIVKVADSRRRYQAQAAVDEITRRLDPLPQQGLARFMEGQDDPARSLPFEGLQNRHAASFLLNTIRVEQSLQQVLAGAVERGLLLDAGAVSRSLSGAIEQYLQHYLETWSNAYSRYRPRYDELPQRWDDYRRWLRDNLRTLDKEYGERMEVVTRNVLELLHDPTQPQEVREALHRHLELIRWPADSKLKPFVENCRAAGALPDARRVLVEWRTFADRAADYRFDGVDDLSRPGLVFPQLGRGEQGAALLRDEWLTRQLQHVVDHGRWLLWSEICRKFFDDHLRAGADHKPFIFAEGAFEGAETLKLKALLGAVNQLKSFRDLQDEPPGSPATASRGASHAGQADWLALAAEWHDFLSRDDCGLELSHNPGGRENEGFAEYYTTLALRLPGLSSTTGEVRSEETFAIGAPRAAVCRWRPAKGRVEITLRDLTAALRSRNAELEPRLIPSLGGSDSEYGLLELIRKYGALIERGAGGSSDGQDRQEWLIAVSKNIREIQGLQDEQTEQAIRTAELRVKFLDPASGIPAPLVWPEFAALAGPAPRAPE